MKDFSITFSRPWFLLLFLAILALVLIPHFTLKKKYRRTRNRIIPIVLHLLISVFAISLLSGITIAYSTPNKENELILVVDVSDTTQPTSDKRDQLVENILGGAAYDGYRVGVVTFGYGSKLAVPMTYDVRSAYNRYATSSYPDDVTATDLSSAIAYAADLFDNPKTGKIVLITDGKETDGSITVAVRSVAAKGIMLDTVYFSSATGESDVQVSSIDFPSNYIKQGETVVISVTVDSNKNYDTEATLVVDGEEKETKKVKLTPGKKTIDYNYVFETRGMHTVSVKITSDDAMKTNDTYLSYINIELFNDVLIISQFDDNQYLSALLQGKGVEGETKFLLGDAVDEFNVTCKKISDESLPKTVEELRNYDQVIINNVSNAAMSKVDGFVDALYSYVHDFGGGLLTVGGNDSSGNANLYSKADLENSKFQEMLPVSAVNYTPPLGVMIIIDVSGSMTEELLNRAKAGAKSVLNVLSERDYIGVMTLSSNYNRLLPLTPATENEKIIKAIDNLDGSGGTSFSSAVGSAASQLTSNANIDRRHIIILSDCQVTETEVKAFEKAMSDANEIQEITLSIVGVDVANGSDPYLTFNPICKKYGGNFYAVTSDYENISNSMRQDINTDEIKDLNLKPVAPTVYPSTLAASITYNLPRADGSYDQLDFALSGFYGGKIKDPDYLVLTGQYKVPIYALRTFGKGRVGSFMCDLSGKWSKGPLIDEETKKEYNGLLNTASGQLLVYDMLYSVMPSTDVKPKMLSLQLDAENYTNKLNIYTTIENGDVLEVTVTDLKDTSKVLSLKNSSGNAKKDDWYVIQGFSQANGYSNATFVIKRQGNYSIKAVLTKKDGKVYKDEIYKSFSYSKEYDMHNYDVAVIKKKLSDSCERTGGQLIDDDDVQKIFQSFVTKEEHTYDPKYLFMILAIILFVLEVAVRKFKFKWPHELIRAYKTRGKNE